MLRRALSHLEIAAKARIAPRRKLLIARLFRSLRSALHEANLLDSSKTRELLVPHTLPHSHVPRRSPSSPQSPNSSFGLQHPHRNNTAPKHAPRRPKRVRVPWITDLASFRRAHEFIDARIKRYLKAERPEWQTLDDDTFGELALSRNRVKELGANNAQSRIRFAAIGSQYVENISAPEFFFVTLTPAQFAMRDRKSTRLNSSHSS